MDIKTFILRLGLLCLFLFSGNGHAIPMVTGFANSEDAKGRDVRFVNVASTHKSEPEPDEIRAFALVLAQHFESFGIGALPGKYYAPFDFLHGFYSLFGFSLQDRSMEKSITWASPDASEDIVIFGNLVGFEDTDVDIAEFFAILGFDITDWHRIMENPHTSGQHDPAPVPDGAVARLGQRKECLQRQREFSRKSELPDNDCFEAGGFGGFNSSAGRSRISAIVNSSNADPNFRNNPGAGGGGGSGGAGGGGSGGTSPGTSAGGGEGDNGSGSGGLPGTSTGEGEGGTDDSEVRPVPEPATPALLLLGLASVYYTRNRIRRR